MKQSLASLNDYLFAQLERVTNDDLTGEALNCDISNLQMVSLAENCRMNQSHMRFSDPELTKTGIMVAKLSNAAGKKKRSLKND